MEVMAEDWVHLQLGMHLQLGILQYFVSVVTEHQQAVKAHKYRG